MNQFPTASMHEQDFRRQERRRERGKLKNGMLEGICSQLTVVKQIQCLPQEPETEGQTQLLREKHRSKAVASGKRQAGQRTALGSGSGDRLKEPLCRAFWESMGKAGKPPVSKESFQHFSHTDTRRVGLGEQCLFCRV